VKTGLEYRVEPKACRHQITKRGRSRRKIEITPEKGRSSHIRATSRDEVVTKDDVMARAGSITKIVGRGQDDTAQAGHQKLKRSSIMVRELLEATSSTKANERKTDKYSHAFLGWRDRWRI
jgi:hypothetical protein